jgi:ribonuclease HII
MPSSLAQLSLREIRQKYSADEAVVSAQLLRRLQKDPRAGARELYKSLARRFEEQKREKNRLGSMLHFERVLWKAGISNIAGVDEVGIGPLAGPVVAAAVIFPPETEIEGVDDSKALDHETRVRLDMEIRSKARAIGLGVIEVAEIDRINIYHAGIQAMKAALADLNTMPQHVLVDSRTIPGLPQPQNSFDKGDGINFSIAAASIVAKVYRDQLMTNLDEAYPGYGFSNHKGYATPEHQDAIRKLGPCPIHRKSFDYIREICGQYSDLYYGLKKQGAAAASREDLVTLTSSIQEAASVLSLNENKKLHLMLNRLWRRLE